MGHLALAHFTRQNSALLRMPFWEMRNALYQRCVLIHLAYHNKAEKGGIMRGCSEMVEDAKKDTRYTVIRVTKNFNENPIILPSS